MKWNGSQLVSNTTDCHTPLSNELVFEGMGDCMWVPGQNIVMGGYGYRTERAAVDALAQRIAASVVPLQLVHPSFYHLDTCLSPIDHERALYVPEAFDEVGREALQKQFSALVPVPVDEALHIYAMGIVQTKTPLCSAARRKQRHSRNLLD